MPYTPTRYRSFVLVLAIAIVSGFSERSSPSAAGQLATQPGAAYALILGPSTIDDGLAPTSDTGQSVSSGLSAAAGMFGSATANTPPPAVAAAKNLDAAIPSSEYDLTELAKTLPDDPEALYRFVTDRIAVDGYDGVMRGPLVTWMSRAGSPTDKTVLLAWLLVTKHVPYQFVRGTLAPAERARVADAAASRGPEASPDPRVASYTAALTRDGGDFATWARGLLSAAHVATGDATAAADRLSSRHYWIQIVRNNNVLDLDPTLPSTAPGTHLGTADAAFKPTAVFPKEEWHQIEIRVTASFANNTEQTIVDRTDTVANVAYAPIRIVFAPAAPADPAQPGTATTFDAGVQIGSTNAGHARLDLGSGPTNVRSVVLDVRRKAPDGAVVEVARRSLIDAHTPAGDRAYRLAGMTTMIVAPGRGAIAFATHMQFRALQQWAQAAADAAKGTPPAQQSWYPIRLIDYFERDDAVADAVASTGGARLFRDRPNIAMLRTSFVRRGTDTDVVTTFDIVDNGMDSLEARRDAVVTENMIRGYADTRIEHDVVETSSGTGTIALFAAARAGNVAPTVMTQAPASIDDLHEGVDRTVAAGQIAIAPSTPVKLDDGVRYGWWAIDPKTGNSVGRMTGGVGQDLAEETTISTMSRAYTLYSQMQTAQTCAKSGFGSAGCAAAVCASIASFVFGGGTVGHLAANYAAGQVATAGCSGGFGAGDPAAAPPVGSGMPRLRRAALPIPRVPTYSRLDRR